MRSGRPASPDGTGKTLDKPRSGGRECASASTTRWTWRLVQHALEPPEGENPWHLGVGGTGSRVPLVSLATVAAFLVGMQDAQAASQISLSGTGAPVTGDAPASGVGDVTQAEFVGEADDERPTSTHTRA